MITDLTIEILALNKSCELHFSAKISIVKSVIIFIPPINVFSLMIIH